MAPHLHYQRVLRYPVALACFLPRAEGSADLRLGQHEIVAACERVNMHLETWQRQERAFGLMRRVYAKRAALRGRQPTPVVQPFQWNDWTDNDEWNQG